MQVNHKTVVKMQVAVLVCFIICRTPLHIEKAIFTVITLTNRWDEKTLHYHGILKMIAGIAFYTNATVNPFLYSLLSKRFRRGFQDLLAFCGLMKPSAGDQIVENNLGAEINQLPEVQTPPGGQQNNQRQIVVFYSENYPDPIRTKVDKDKFVTAIL